MLYANVYIVRDIIYLMMVFSPFIALLVFRDQYQLLSSIDETRMQIDPSLKRRYATRKEKDISNINNLQVTMARTALLRRLFLVAPTSLPDR